MTSLVSGLLVLLICVTISLYTSIIIRSVLRLKRELILANGWKGADSLISIYTTLLSVYILTHNLNDVALPESILSSQSAVMIMIHIFLIGSGFYLMASTNRNNPLTNLFA